MASKKSAKADMFGIGSKVFIRTVTHHYTGEVLHVSDAEIVLVKAAWIADSGRFAGAMSTGEFSEVEPYPDTFEVVISRGSIVDYVRNWPHELPRSQK